MAAFSITEAMVGWIASLGIRAATHPPVEAPDVFATVERTGGGVDSLVDHASVAVQVWAASETDAEEAANTLRLAFLTQAPPAGIHSVRVDSGPYPFWDEGTKMPRYQLALDVACQLEI